MVCLFADSDRRYSPGTLYTALIGILCASAFHPFTGVYRFSIESRLKATAAGGGLRTETESGQAGTVRSASHPSFRTPDRH